jgi:hypothetical protein
MFTDLLSQRENGIAAVTREAKGNETAEELEKERLAEQHLIDTGMSHVTLSGIGLTRSPLISISRAFERRRIRGQAESYGARL